MKRIKQSVALYFTILMFCTSCATLNVDEIRNLDRTAFDPPELKPAYESNNLRIDLIRKTFTENISDSVTETKDTPYHPLGFDLGNGLFYDINENICLRLDFLLGFSGEKNFEIHEAYRGKNKKGIIVYRFCNDTLKVNYMYGKNLHYRYHIVNDANQMMLMHRKRTKYSIELTDSSAVYRENNSKPRIIQPVGKDQYDLNIRKRKDHFRKTGSDVFLNNEYIVSMTSNNLAIEIKNPHKRKNNILYTVEKSNNQIFIYNKRFSGIKIDKNKDSILLYRNKVLWTKFELTN